MPDTLDSFNFKENPYTSILGSGSSSQMTTPQGAGQQEMPPQGMGQGAGQGAPQQGMGAGMSAEQAPQQAQQSAQSATGQEGMEEEENQFAKGQNPDKGKPLMGAIQALENYITVSEDRDSILTARAIIGLLTKLMAKDQEEMMNK